MTYSAKTQELALKLAEKVAERLRRRGYTVFQNPDGTWVTIRPKEVDTAPKKKGRKWLGTFPKF